MILIGTEAGIFRWASGNSWATFHGLQGRNVTAIASLGGGPVVALDSEARVWESGDNGLNWREIPTPDNAGRPSAAGIGGSPAAILTAFGSIGPHKRSLGAPLPKDSLPAVLRYLDDVGRDVRVLASVTTFGRIAPPKQRASRPRTLESTGWASIGKPGSTAEIRFISAEGPTWFLSAAGAGLWSSGDSGASWSKVEGLSDNVFAIRSVPGKTGLWFAATSDGCRFSDDDGKTWAPRDQGLENARHVRALDIKPGEPSTLYAGAAPSSATETRPGARPGLGYGLYESRDGGKSWSQMSRNFASDLGFDEITDIRFDPADPDRAAVSLGSGEVWITLTDGFYWQPLARQFKGARALCPTR